MQPSENLDSSLRLVAKSSLIFFIGIVFSKIFTYIYKVITARNFGQETYGLFSLTLMLSGFFIAFFSLGLQSGLLRYVSFFRGKDQKEKIRYIFKFSLKLTFPISLIAGALLFFLSDIISINIFHNQELAIFLRWFAFFIPISLFGGIFHTILRAYEKIKWYSLIGNILVTFIQLVFLVLFVFFGLKNKAIIFSYNLGMLALLVSSFFVCKCKIPEVFVKSKIKKDIRKNLIKDLFSYSWPVMFLGLVISIFSWIDSFAIGYFKTVSDVGLYNAAVPIAFLLGITPLLFLQLFFPLITREYSKKNFELINKLSKQIGKWIFILNLPFLIIMVLFPGAIINIFFGADYMAAENSLRFLSIGIFFYSVFVVSENLLSMVGKSKIILMNFIIAAIINTILNIILVPKYGIEGAAFSTMLSYIVWSLLSLFMARHYISIIPLKRKMIRIAFITLIPIIILFFIRRFFEINLLMMIIFGFFFILSYFLLILITRCFDENDLIVLKAIKQKFIRTSKK